MDPNPERTHPETEPRRAPSRVVVYGGLALLLFYAAIPRFDGLPRPSANENAAVATLRNVAAAQAELRERGQLDRDGDGIGEYGYLAQLAGAAPARGGGRVEPPLLAPSFRRARGGRLLRSGYRFAMFLRGVDGSWLAEPDGAEAVGVEQPEVDADAAERAWLLYAWPSAPERSGRRGFVVDQRGEVHATAIGAEPEPGVTGFAADNGRRQPADGVVDARGDVWARVR